MSRYQDLCSAYTKWHEKGFDSYMTIHLLSIQLPTQFRRHIQAPDKFVGDPIDENSPALPYVELVRMNFIDESETDFVPERCDSASETIQRDKDGDYYFALSITLEMSPATWPKRSFPIPIRVRILNEKTTITIAKQNDGDFSFIFGNQSANAPLYDYMCDFLVRALSESTTERQPIGFNPRRPAKVAD